MVATAFLACHCAHCFLFLSRPSGILAQDESLCRLWHTSGNGLPSSFLAQGGRCVTFYIPFYWLMTSTTQELWLLWSHQATSLNTNPLSSCSLRMSLTSERLWEHFRKLLSTTERFTTIVFLFWLIFESVCLTSCPIYYWIHNLLPQDDTCFFLIELYMCDKWS